MIIDTTTIRKHLIEQVEDYVAAIEDDLSVLELFADLEDVDADFASSLIDAEDDEYVESGSATEPLHGINEAGENFLAAGSTP